MTKRMVIWTLNRTTFNLHIIMRDKADDARFPINVAKSIFLTEIPKTFTASPCIFNKNVFWVWKVFLQTRNSIGLTLAGWRKGRQGATWVAIPLPGASFPELFSLPGNPLAPGRFLPATTFQLESLITCCTMVQEEDCLFEVTFSDVILYEWR